MSIALLLQGREEGAEIDPWEDPAFEVYHVLDRWGFIQCVYSTLTLLQLTIWLNDFQKKIHSLFCITLHLM